jgi:hypothetical protein
MSIARLLFPSPGRFNATNSFRGLQVQTSSPGLLGARSRLLHLISLLQPPSARATEGIINTPRRKPGVWGTRRNSVPDITALNGKVGAGAQVTGNAGAFHGSTQHPVRTRFALKTKAKSLARVRSVGTLPWLGFDRVQPNRSLLPGKHCRINA